MSISIPCRLLFLLAACLPPLSVPAEPFSAGAVDENALPTVPPGFAVMVFAREPLVRNPCAMAFDAQGRLCVGMGPQYRNPKPDTPPDEVVILEDTNRDGVADGRKVFATGLNCIQGLAWHGRDLWVANAPDLTIVRDLDGDDVADEYVKVFTDLGNIEHAVHGLNWGPDGRLYMSKGNSKGRNQPDHHAPKPFRELWGLPDPDGARSTPTLITSSRGDYKATYHPPADDWGRAGGVLRCDADGGNLEIFARGLRNPWDIAFDSGFNWLGTDNDQDGGDRNFMPFHGADFGWGHAWSTSWTGAHHPPTVPITGPTYEGSGTGITFYAAAQFPGAFQNAFFWNDWLRKTTFIYRPRWDGSLMKQEGAWQKFAEAGPQNALYRPVDIETGPDGALWVTGWGKSYGVEWDAAGKQTNEGRVFRIFAKETPLLRWSEEKRSRPLEQWSVAELAADLGSHLPVWRTNAQLELMKRGHAVKKDLLTLAHDRPPGETAQTWLLWTLGLLDVNDAETEEHFADVAINGASLNQRIQALRILAHRAKVKTSGPVARLPSVTVTCLEDKEPRIRFEAVQAIWQTRLVAAIPALADLAATETDQVTFYATWNALRDLAGVDQLRAFLEDQRPRVRRAALLALAALGKLLPTDAQRLATHPATADVAVLWLAKRNGNPLIVCDPQPGDFTDQVSVRLTPGMKPAQIRYTLDGSMPGPKSRPAEGPIALTETATLKASLFMNGLPVGPPAEMVYHKRSTHDASAPGTMTLTPPAQATTVAQALAALPKGSHERGRALFFAAGGAGCSACHRIGPEGRSFGPDLTTLGERGDPEALVRSMIEPGAVITEGYSMQVITLKDGQMLGGILRDETDLHLTLVQPGGEPLRIEKATIKDRDSSHTSVMPPFGALLTPEQIADLVAFLSRGQEGASR